jgi:arylsulfatase A-like enzyme
MKVCFLLQLFVSAAALPNIVFFLADDLGQGSIGYNNPEILTPAIDALAADGVILNEHYTYQYCSPTRGAFLTGRYGWRTEGIRGNLLPLWKLESLHLGYTLLPRRLKEAGYSTHFFGKWHLGASDPKFTPTSRGFDTSLGFYDSHEHHFSKLSIGYGPIAATPCGADHPVHDLFRDGNPAIQDYSTPADVLYATEATSVINKHAQTYGSTGTPLFLYIAPNTPHSPTEAEQRFEDLYPGITDPLQKTFYAMLSAHDEGVKNVVDALKSNGLWDNTLFVWAADNGSPVLSLGGTNTDAGGSNGLFRGTKSSNWEGGVRNPAVVSGGYLPASQRGKRLDGISHITDWYATFLKKL